MHSISRKYSNQQIFQYSKKHKNLKEQRKTQRISWNEKRCAENAKISGEIRERNTQHDKHKKKCSVVWIAKKAKGSCLDVVHTLLDDILPNHRSIEPQASELKNRFIQTFHTGS